MCHVICDPIEVEFLFYVLEDRVLCLWESSCGHEFLKTIVCGRLRCLGTLLSSQRTNRIAIEDGQTRLSECRIVTLQMCGEMVGGTFYTAGVLVALLDVLNETVSVPLARRPAFGKQYCVPKKSRESQVLCCAVKVASTRLHRL